MDDDPIDPTRMRNQPAFRTSEGTEWIVIGLVLAGISSAVLLFQDHATSDVVAAVVIALFVAMLVVRLAVPRRRPRVTTLAVLLALIPIVTIAELLALIAL
jgi:uncharacterized protein YacL